MPGAGRVADVRALAQDAQAAGDWARAQDLWLAAVEQSPTAAGGWIQLGNMRNELADHAGALDAFAEAARLDPASYDAIAGKAGVHERAGQWQKAREAWLDATRLADGNESRLSHAHAHAILAAIEQGDPDDVRRVTSDALVASPRLFDDPAHTFLQAKLLRGDQPAVAKQLLAQHIRRVRRDAAARFDYASICLDDGDYQDGIDVLAPRLDETPLDASVAWLGADLHERLGNQPDVLDLCQRMVDAGSHDLRFVRRAFAAAVRLGDLAAARRCARRYAVLCDGELELVDQLRAAYDEAGETRRARLLCRWLCHRWPHSLWHFGRYIVLTGGTLGLVAADRLVHRVIARIGHDREFDRAYCHAAFAANEPAEAQRRLEWYLATSGKDDADSKVLLGYALANSAGLGAAEAHFLTLAAATFQSRGALVGLAHMASRRRDPRATLELWAKVSALYPDDTIARVEHARATYDLGDHHGARAISETRLRAVPTDVTMGEFHAWLLVVIGENEAARAYLPSLTRYAGPNWAALEAAIQSAGQLGALDRDWPAILRMLPRGSTQAASSRLYHIVRLLLYFERPALAAELLNACHLDPLYAAWVGPYGASHALPIDTRLRIPAETRWRHVAARVTDAPARALDAMSDQDIAAALQRPAHEQPVVHIVNKFEQARGGSELHALDLAARLAKHARVELWAPETPHPEFSARHNVRAVDRSQGRAPHGGVVVFIGVYFPIGWLADSLPERVIFLYNTFEAPTMYARVAEAAALTGVPVELLFCSDLMGRECGLPGLFEPSPIDIDVFTAAPIQGTRPFTLGRHSRDVTEKHHPDDGTIYREMAELGGQSVLLGGTCMRSSFQAVPRLELLPARTRGMVDFLRRLDVYFYRTSTWVEPWGRVVVEAMACEVPVLVHDGGGYAQIIRHEENGLLFHTTDEAVALLRRLHANPELRRRLGQAGRDTVERLLSEAATARLTMFYLLHGGAAS